MPCPTRSRGSPRPGIATLPSTVTGGEPSAGAIVTKAPPAGEQIPGSHTIATRTAASAASTALPPVATACTPAAAASALLAATATDLVTRASCHPAAAATGQAPSDLDEDPSAVERLAHHPRE